MVKVLFTILKFVSISREKKMYTFENLIDNDAVLLPERKKFREIKLPQAQDIDHHIIIDMFTTESRNFMSKCQSFKRLVIIGLL